MTRPDASAARTAARPPRSSSRPPARATLLAGLGATVVVLAFSLLVGGLTSPAQGFLPEWMSSLANSAGGWSMLAFLGVWLSRARPLLGAVLGAVSFVAMVEAYGVVSLWRGYFLAHPFSSMWIPIGLVAGPFIGLAAALVRHASRRWTIAGVAVLSAVLVAEGDLRPHGRRRDHQPGLLDPRDRPRRRLPRGGGAAGASDTGGRVAGSAARLGAIRRWPPAGPEPSPRHQAAVREDARHPAPAHLRVELGVRMEPVGQRVPLDVVRSVAREAVEVRDPLARLPPHASDVRHVPARLRQRERPARDVGGVARREAAHGSVVAELDPGGPGTCSLPGQRIEDASTIGVSGWPRRTRSRKPCSAGTKVRWSIDRAPTMLMPTLSEITSAGSSAMASATNGSSMHWPPKPRPTRSSPACRAATTGHAPVGSGASTQWLMELPWWVQRGSPSGSAARTGSSAVTPTRSTSIPCGSQTVTVDGPCPSPRSTTTDGSPDPTAVSSAASPDGGIRRTTSTGAATGGRSTPSTSATNVLRGPGSSSKRMRVQRTRSRTSAARVVNRIRTPAAVDTCARRSSPAGGKSRHLASGSRIGRTPPGTAISPRRPWTRTDPPSSPTTAPSRADAPIPLTPPRPSRAPARRRPSAR